MPGLLGGLVGGLVGNQFGGGNGRKALTVIGALAGSSIARQARPGPPHYGSHDEYDRLRSATAPHCETTWEDRSIRAGDRL